MSHADKVEVMDFLINVLKDHEKSLDTLISRAEYIVEDKHVPKEIIQNPPGLRISLKEWEEFCDRSIESELVCFDLIDSSFHCYAITKNKVFTYNEDIPTISYKLDDIGETILSDIELGEKIEKTSFLKGKLSNGLELKAIALKNNVAKKDIQYELDLSYTKNWLSRELGIHRDFIVRGNIDL